MGQLQGPSSWQGQQLLPCLCNPTPYADQTGPCWTLQCMLLEPGTRGMHIQGKHPRERIMLARAASRAHKHTAAHWSDEKQQCSMITSCLPDSSQIQEQAPG